jgi:hypothetical protein
MLNEQAPMSDEIATLARLGADARARSLYLNAKQPVLRQFQRREITRADFDAQVAVAQAAAEENRQENEAIVQAAVDGGALTPEVTELASEGVTENKNQSTSEQAFTFLYERGLLAMDAAMFSLIGFFILSAAYRAFRIRSIEASILMATALVVLLMFVPIALMLTSGLDPDTFAGNFRIDSIGSWLLSTINVPAIRAIDLGLGLGLLAMGLRIMLGLEKGVASE